MPKLEYEQVCIATLKEYQAISEDRDRIMAEFEYFVEHEYDWSNDMLPLPQSQEELEVIIKQAIAQFLMQDEKTQKLIKDGEQFLLERNKK